MALNDLYNYVQKRLQDHFRLVCAKMPKGTYNNTEGRYSMYMPNCLVPVSTLIDSNVAPSRVNTRVEPSLPHG